MLFKQHSIYIVDMSFACLDPIQMFEFRQDQIVNFISVYFSVTEVTAIETETCRKSDCSYMIIWIFSLLISGGFHWKSIGSNFP